MYGHLTKCASTVAYMPPRDTSPPHAGALFREYRDQKGWSLRAVAQRAGLNHNTVAHFEENGVTDGTQHATIEKLARGYGMDERKFRRICASGSMTDDYGAPIGVEALKVHPDWIMLPVRASVSAGAPEAQYILGEVAYIPREHLRRRGAMPDNVDVFAVNGRCMVSDEARKIEKNYAPGDFIAVDRSRTPDIGDVVVAWWDEEQTLVVKRYMLERANVMLYPLSSAHVPIVLPTEEEVHILGPVVWRGG